MWNGLAVVTCKPPAIPEPCAKPPIPLTNVVLNPLVKMDGLQFSRSHTMQHVDSNKVFLHSDAGGEFGRMQNLKSPAKHAPRLRLTSSVVYINHMESLIAIRPPVQSAHFSQREHRCLTVSD